MNPDQAMAKLLQRLEPVDAEEAPLTEAAGRSLAQRVHADRDHPACDVSAMDGFAARLSEAQASAEAKRAMPIAGEVAMGQAPPELPVGSVVRLFTGAAVPEGADTVLRREHTQEQPEAIVIDGSSKDLKPGANIRHRGENIQAGQPLLEPGTPLTAATIAGLASFGVHRVWVRRRVRVGLLVTGSELRDASETPAEQAIRDSNGPMLGAMLAGKPWVQARPPQRVPDEPRALRERIEIALKGGDEQSPVDALFLTGGVSMGDHDDVPQALRESGVEIVFHRLPIRPGMPLLAGVGPRGQAVLGFPGNPVSALTTATAFGLPTLAHLAGRPRPQPTRVRLANDDSKRIHLWWYRLVRWIDPQTVELVGYRGSGDVAALSRSDGVVLVPPEDQPRAQPGGSLAFWRWCP